MSGPEARRAARLVAALARALLLLYPPSFRREVGAGLVRDVRRRAAELTAAGRRLRLLLWITRLLASLVANALLAWVERTGVGGRAGHAPAPRRRGRASVLSWLDVKLGLRMLAKSPGLTLAGGTAIAVAIAVSVGFFGFTWSFFYPKIPLDEGDRLVGLENWDLRINNENRRSLHDFVLWREEMKSVDDMSAYRTVSRNLIQADGTAELVRIAEMTPSAFRLARVPPLVGRTLVPADARRDAPPVLVIGYDVWRTRFASDPGIVGRTVRLGTTVYTIVGVMPGDFAFPVNHDLWAPLKADPADVPVGRGPSIFIVGRLAPGFTLDDAQAELTVLGRRSAERWPETHARFRAQIMPYILPAMDINQQGAKSYLPLFAQLAALLTLLLVVLCVNVAILVYARVVTRRGEIAVRTALGAPRGRIVAQLFVEALVLSGTAAAVGLVVARAGMVVGQKIMETEVVEIPFWFRLGIPGPALAFAVGLTLLAALITGVVPGLQATGRRVQASLSEFHKGGGARLGRTWTALVVAQVGVAVMGLPIAVATGWWEVRGATTVPTYPIEHVLSVRTAPDPEAFEGMDPDAWARTGAADFASVQHELRGALAAEPEVRAHGFTMNLPGRGAHRRVAVEEVGGSAGDAAGQAAEVGSVDPGYFEAVGDRVLAGRTFTEAEREAGAADVVVVNRTFVHRVLGDGTALGRRIRILPEGEGARVDTLPERWADVVGVVEDLQRNAVDSGLLPAMVYRPLPRVPLNGAPILLLRVAGADPAELTARVREIAARIDPTLRVAATPLDDMYRQERLALELAALVLALGMVAVLLMSAAGVYALMSFTVAQRRREIGIRTALGARPRALLGSIFRRAATQVALGVVVGAGAGVGLDAVSGGELLHGLGGALLPAMVVLVGGAGLVAAVGPARRGLALEPAEVLKEE